MSADLELWALPRLKHLLPLDDESLREIIRYTVSLSKEAGAEHLKNLLGDLPQAIDFISSFNARRVDVLSSQHPPPTPSQHPSNAAQLAEEIPRSRPRGTKKSKPPLHSAGPVRRPEGYGDVTGGYQKTATKADYPVAGSASVSLSNSLALSKEPDALQLPKVTLGGQSTSATSSRDPSPRPQKLPPSAAGNLISHMPNVRTKQSKRPTNSGTASPQRQTTATTSSIGDLTSAIAALELSTNPSLSSERRRCDCNASLHPLFTTAPNCLSCGKIICALEGLQPCSYCDSPLLSKDQVNSMIQTLKQERGQERMATHNASRSGRATPTFSSGLGHGNGGNTPESTDDDLESPSTTAASLALAHRDKLLSYQSQNAQRTRIHDEAADYDLATLTPGTTQWMTPVQRAAALKRQQQYLREMEEAHRPDYEKKRTVMSMSFRNGKLVRTFEKRPVTESESGLASKTDEEEENGDTSGGGNDTGETARSLPSGTGAFSHNPLLAMNGELIRPVWKAPIDTGATIHKREKGKDGSPDQDSERKNGRGGGKWTRRVQDDDEDNEQWILDGGLYGHDSNG